jgi:hypothetical protein
MLIGDFLMAIELTALQNKFRLLILQFERVYLTKMPAGPKAF